MASYSPDNDTRIPNESGNDTSDYAPIPNADAQVNDDPYDYIADEYGSIEKVLKTEKEKEPKIEDIDQTNFNSSKTSEVKDQEGDPNTNASTDSPDLNKTPDMGIFPESFKKPEFRTQKEALEFYEKNYKELLEYPTKPEFIEKIANDYENVLLAREKNVEQLKNIDTALKGNPTVLFKQLFGIELERFGIDSKYDDGEKESILNTEMQNLYGKDWQSKIVEAELQQPGTLSYNMQRNFQNIKGQIDEHNKQADQLYEAIQPPSPESEQKTIDDQYNQHFKGQLDREEYNEFINDFKGWKYDMRDMHYAMNREKYQQAAYDKGVQDGKKSLTKEISKIGERITPESEKEKKEQRVYQERPDKEITLSDIYKKKVINDYFTYDN